MAGAMDIPRASRTEAHFMQSFDEMDWSKAIGAKTPPSVTENQDSHVQAVKMLAYINAAARQEDLESKAGSQHNSFVPNPQVPLSGLETPGGTGLRRGSVNPAMVALSGSYDGSSWDALVYSGSPGAEETVEPAKPAAPASSPVLGSRQAPRATVPATSLSAKQPEAEAARKPTWRSSQMQVQQRQKSASLVEVGESKLTKTRLGFWRNLSPDSAAARNRGSTEGSKSVSSQITAASSGGGGGLMSPSTSEATAVESAGEQPPDGEVVMLRRPTVQRVEDIFGDSSWDKVEGPADGEGAGPADAAPPALLSATERARSSVSASLPPPLTPMGGTMRQSHLQVLQEESPHPSSPLSPQLQAKEDVLRQQQERLEEERFLLQQQRTELKRREQEWQAQQRKEELALDQQRRKQSDLERQLKSREQEGNRELYEERASLLQQRQALEQAQLLFRDQRERESAVQQRKAQEEEGRLKRETERLRLEQQRQQEHELQFREQKQEYERARQQKEEERRKSGDLSSREKQRRQEEERQQQLQQQLPQKLQRQLDQQDRQVSQGSEPLLKESELQDELAASSSPVRFHSSPQPQAQVVGGGASFRAASPTLGSRDSHDSWMAHSSAVYSLQKSRLMDEKPIEEWDEQDVVTWLMQFSMVPDELIELLYAHAINGAVLITLGEEDLGELGITKFGHKRLLNVAAQELRAALSRRTGGAVPSTPNTNGSTRSTLQTTTGSAAIPSSHFQWPSPAALDASLSASFAHLPARTPQAPSPVPQVPGTVTVTHAHGSSSPLAPSGALPGAALAASPRTAVRQVFSPTVSSRSLLRVVPQAYDQTARSIRTATIQHGVRGMDPAVARGAPVAVPAPANRPRIESPPRSPMMRAASPC